MLSLEVSRSRSTLLLGQPFFFNSVFDGTFDFIAYGSFLWQLLVLLVWLFVFIFTCTFVVGFRCVCVCVARLFDLVLLFFSLLFAACLRLAAHSTAAPIPTGRPPRRPSSTIANAPTA